MNITRIGLTTCCILAMTACSDGDTGKKGPPPPVPVAAAKAVARDIPVTLQVVGRAEAFENVALKSRIDGQVAEVLFAEGQHVKRGDILIQLDPADYMARLRQAEATVTRDTALIAKAKADTARYSMLKERKFVSDEKVNDVRTNESTALANQQASKSAADLARLQLSYATIRAPIDGVVGARIVFPGTAIKNNDTTLAVINRIQPLLVSFPVPERHLPRLRAAFRAARSDTSGIPVSITTPESGATSGWQGRIRFIDNAVDSATGTVLMKAEFPNVDEQLTPGQFVNVSIRINTLKDSVAVPDEAIQQGAENNYVYIVKEDHGVELRPVETAASDGGLTAVTSGIALGETVVTDGQLRLEPGVKVKIKPTETNTDRNSDQDANGRSVKRSATAARQAP